MIYITGVHYVLVANMSILYKGLWLFGFREEQVTMLFCCTLIITRLSMKFQGTQNKVTAPRKHISMAALSETKHVSYNQRDQNLTWSERGLKNQSY